MATPAFSQLLPDGVRNAVRQKEVNVRACFRLFLNAEPSRKELLTYGARRFGALIDYVMMRPEWREGILPALASGGRVHCDGPIGELREWAAERLVSDASRLLVLSATDYEGLLLALTASPDSVLFHRLPQDVFAQLKARREAWIQADPRRQTRFFVETPSVSEIEAIFEVFLHRPPNRRDNVGERRRAGYAGVLRRFLRSAEFNWRLQRLLCGDPAGRKGAVAAFRPLMERTLDFLPIEARQARSGLDAASWEGVLRAFWADAEVVAFLTALLDDEADDDGPRGAIRRAHEALNSPVPAMVGVRLERNTLHGAALITPDSPLTAPEVHDADGRSVRVVGFSSQSLDGRRDLARFDVELAPEDVFANQGREISIAFGGQSQRISATAGATNAADIDVEEMMRKAHWHIRMGRPAKAEALSSELRYNNCDDAGLRVLYEVELAEGRPQRAGEILDASQAVWAKAMKQLEALHAGVDEVTIEPQVLDALEARPSGGVLLDWIEGDAPRADYLDYLNGRLAARSSTLEGVIQRMTALVAANAPDAMLARALSPATRFRRREVRKLEKTAEREGCISAMVRAGAYMDPDLVCRLNIFKGALKHSEAIGRFGHALDLTRTHLRRAIRPIPDDVLLAAQIENKYGEAGEALARYRQALDLSPDNQDIRRQWLNYMRAAAAADPLLLDEGFHQEASALVEARTQAVMREPGRARLREALADALFIRGDEAAAFEMLAQLFEGGDISDDGAKRLVDLAVRRKRNELALAVVDALPIEERSQWVLLNQVRALRALDRAREAGAVLDGAANSETPVLMRERVRNHFFLEEFDKAAALADELSDRHGEDVEMRMVAAAAHLELGDVQGAARHVQAAESSPKADRVSDELNLFNYAMRQKARDPDAVEALSPMFDRMGVCRLRGVDGATGGFDEFTADGRRAASQDEYPPVFDGPMVSIIMTAYNSEAYIDTAIRSILEQSYQSIELIVVDDLSSDSTPQKLLDWEKRDPRVTAILKTENSGTYVSKNMGLLQARGEFVALQDSDDWSHPDRIAKSVGVLAARSEVMGLTTDWLRMTSEGALQIKAGGQISHVCCISLVFRRKPVLDGIGFFDSVRIEADMEYIRRLELKFGKPAMLRLRWPLLFGRVRSDSLTGNEEFGITRTGFSQPRLDYQAEQAAYHDQIRQGRSAVMPFPLANRLFEAPDLILPDKGEGRTAPKREPAAKPARRKRSRPAKPKRSESVS